MGYRLIKGIGVRILYSLGILLMTALLVVMYEGGFAASGLWAFGIGILGLVIEGIVTNKMTQGFEWKWFNPATIIFTANGLACIWFLQVRTLAYDTQGLQVCINYTARQELARTDMTVVTNWLDFCSCGHCNGAAEQLFVILLLIGRYFVPKGVVWYHPDDDNINKFLKGIASTHFFLVIACNGADALDLISYSRYPGVQGNGYILSILLILFSAGMVQFCIDTLATKEDKNSDMYIIVETDLWSSLVILVTDDLPFMGMRLFLIMNYQVFTSMGVFFLFKNIVSIFVIAHKGTLIWWGKDINEIEEYVICEPYTPEQQRRRMSIMDSPDALDDISDSDSLYSNPQAVKSRIERHAPITKEKTEWGDESEWFGNSKPNDMQTAEQKAKAASQFLGSSEWDVEQGQRKVSNATLSYAIWHPKADPAYFTEAYADEHDDLIDITRVGNQKAIQIPLGHVRVRGAIDFSLALPKPAVRDSKSARNEDDDGEDWEEEEKKPKKSKSKSKDRDRDKDVDEDIDDILNTVDEEEAPKEKKKKKKKDKDYENEEAAEEQREEERREEKKKKKKSKHETNEEEDDDEERREKKKKKKKSKDRDDD